MKVWGLLREYAHVILLAMAITVIAISAVRRGRRPSTEELTKLGKSLLGTATSIFLIAWLVTHKNSDLEGFAVVLMAGLLPYAWSSLCTGYDAIVEMCSKEIPAAPPLQSDDPAKARIVLDTIQTSESAVETEEKTEAEEVEEPEERAAKRTIGK